MDRILIVAFCACVAAPMLHAQRATDPLQTGNDFLRQCDETRVNHKDPVAVAQYMRCGGYVQGFLEAHTMLQVTTGLKATYCRPENVDFGQIERVVTKWLKDNPAKSNLPISVVMEKALIDAFPCANP